jgi:signal transduction histidine kinase
MSDQPLRVLYAEDNPQDADLTRVYFAEHAPEIALQVVDTGRGCLDRLEADAFDVLLLDNLLPDMDGVGVLQEIAARHLSIPTVLVTAVGDEQLVVHVLRLGACDYIAKHGNYLARLPAIVRSALDDYRRRRADSSAADRRHHRVLYVEHNPADIELTWQHFAEAAPHLQLVIARSSAEALRMLDRKGDAFDLVLSDLRMPDMQALDLLAETRQRGIAVPFVVITGRGDEEAAVGALKLGAYDYIVKRDSYLRQLPYAIDNAIHRFHLIQVNRRLQMELAERQRAEHQLRQAQKMESVGRLAGGIAHDFNNLLTVINGSAEMLLLETKPNQDASATLMDILRAGERAAGLTQQLLAFSRRQLLQPRVLALNTLVADSSKMLTRLLGEDIEIVTVLAPSLWHVKADAGQLEQVIMNLAVNARDAMPQGGRLTIETQNVQLHEGYAIEHPSLPPGNYVMLTVSDTGVGMDRDTVARIFDPFFTTKEPGKGTGLGLSTVYGILKQSGGWIWVYSEPAKGTTFKIHLPRADEPVDDDFEPVVELPAVGGTETVVVVEDDEVVRRLTSTALRSYGYAVIEAANGKEGLEAIERHAGPIHLVITDVVMPVMSGRELAGALQRTRPDTQVLYVSGYTDAVVRHGFLDPSVLYLQKPFTPSLLARRVRDVLDRQPAQRS